MKHISILLIVCVLTACVTSSPINDEEFKSIRDIADLVGAYRNKGGSGKSGPTVYLSRIIWPTDISLNYKDIDIVEIQQLDTERLELKNRRVTGQASTVYESTINGVLFLSGKPVMSMIGKSLIIIKGASHG